MKPVAGFIKEIIGGKVISGEYSPWIAYVGDGIAWPAEAINYPINESQIRKLIPKSRVRILACIKLATKKYVSCYNWPVDFDPLYVTDDPENFPDFSIEELRKKELKSGKTMFDESRHVVFEFQPYPEYEDQIQSNTGNS